MRKTAFVLLVLVTAMVFGLPQYCSAQGLSLGIKGGMNMSNFTGDSLTNPESLTGIAIGGYATIGLLPNIAIQPEVFYSQKGCKESGDYLGTPIELTTRINYLEIPVLAKISFGAIVKPYILAGPYFATMIGATQEVTVSGVSVSGDIDDFVKSSDMGLTFGAGVQTPVKLSLEARYSMGLNSIDDSGWDIDIKNSNISLLVGFALF
jgi:hypothetical protein